MPVLLLTVLLSGMGFGLILPGFPFVAEKLGAPHWAGPMVLGLYAIGQFIATPFWGRYSDRFGRRPLLIGSIAGGLVGHLICAFAPNLLVLSFGRLLTGLMGGNAPVAMAYATDISPSEQRAKTMGKVGAFLSLGFIVGPLLGGLLGGADAASATLLWPGLAAASVCLLAIIGASLFLRESLPPESRASRDRASEAGNGGLGAFRQVLKRPVLAKLLTVGFLAYLAMAAFETNFPFWAGDRFGWGPQQIGLSFTYLATLVVTTQGVLVGPLVSRFGEKRLLIAGLSSYIVGLLVMTQSLQWPVMMFGITFTTVGSALYMTTVNSLVSQQAGESERGMVLGTFSTASWFGRSIGPGMVALLGIAGLGRDAPLFAAAVIILPCIAIVRGLRSRAAGIQSAT
ncbi:MAG: MFS transporter [Gammaproteobacteria bacterium]|nr:MFS transporter [Gammaproteobacteria bacterium]